MPAPATEFPVPVPLRRVWLAIGWLLVALVVWLSFTHLPLPGTADGGDKLEHASAYLGLAAWFGSGLASKRYLWLALALAALGGGIELGQGMTSYRDMSFWDWIADLVGTGLGLMAAQLAGRQWFRRISQHWTRA